MTSYYKPSASSLGRSMKCRASSIIPIRVTSDNEAAVIGTHKHRYVELIIGGLTSEEALLKIPEGEYRDACRRTDVSFLNGLTNVGSEISFALDFETGEVRFLGKGLGRDYPSVSDSEYTGTIDVIAMRGDIPIVIDMKSGMTTTPVKYNQQMKFAVCCAEGYFGGKEIEARLLYLREDEDNFSDVHIFKKDEIVSALKDFRDFHHNLIKEAEEYEKYGKLQLHEDFECAYCPAQLACPAKTLALHSLSIKADKLDLDNLPKINKKNAAVAWENYNKIKTYFDAVGGSLREYAEKNGIQGEDYKVTPVEVKRKKNDPNKLIKLAKKLGATDTDIDNCRSGFTFKKLMTKKLTEED